MLNSNSTNKKLQIENKPEKSKNDDVEDWIKMSACKTIVTNDFILRNFMYIITLMYFSICKQHKIIKHILFIFY